MKTIFRSESRFRHIKTDHSLSFIHWASTFVLERLVLHRSRAFPKYRLSMNAESYADAPGIPFFLSRAVYSASGYCRIQK